MKSHREVDKKGLLLLIDNFDSFTYNLFHAFQMLEGIDTQVIRADSKSIQSCLALSPKYIVIGPGPGSPAQAKFSKELLKACEGEIPTLGICLGHQVLAEYYGGVVKRATIPMHGKTSKIFHSNEGVFSNLPQGFIATRYHSLIVEENSLPSYIKVTARTLSKEVMGIKHLAGMQEGVQFHPESILTENGLVLLKNFINHSFNGS
jgi:anthranilate synthase/aminodeoxychorismate synthase-like glutamine amidotransferase